MATVNLTYNTLIESVLQWLERNDADLRSQLPTMIMLAQRRIDNNLNTLGQVQMDFGNFEPPQVNSSQCILVKPARWRNTLSFSIGTGENLETWQQLTLVSYDVLKNYWPDQTQLGTPKYYSDFSYNQWIVAPTPDAAYPIQLSYMQEFDQIDANNQTNWLTENAPEVVFYATLLEAMIFIQNDQRQPLIEQQFSKALQSLDNTDNYRITDRFAKRDKD